MTLSVYLLSFWFSLSCRRFFQKVHCRKVRMQGGRQDTIAVLEHIARNTAGFSGAELANVVNEAAILAAR